MNQEGFAKYVFLCISIIVIVCALIALFFLTKSSKKLGVHAQTMSTPTVIRVPSPILTPLTEQNAQPTIDATEQNMEQTLNQTNNDLQVEGQITSSQDNTTGL